MKGGSDWLLGLSGRQHLGKTILSWVSMVDTLVDSIQCTILQASGDQLVPSGKGKQGSLGNVNKSASGQGPLAVDYQLLHAQNFISLICKMDNNNATLLTGLA